MRRAWPEYDGTNVKHLNPSALLAQCLNNARRTAAIQENVRPLTNVKPTRIAVQMQRVN